MRWLRRTCEFELRMTLKMILIDLNDVLLLIRPSIRHAERT
jgi:hypothetical protein